MNYTLDNFMRDLPIELYIKIMYKSGVISKEAQLIKDMKNNLMIPFENVIYMDGGKSFVKHLVNMDILKEYHEYIDIIYIIGL